MKTIIILSGALALAATSVAAAPPIAYSKAGTGGIDEVWLVNPDGSGATRVYRGSSKMAAVNLAVSPAGGKLAFLETDNTSYAIKVITYSSAGVPQNTTTVPLPAGCVVRGLDLRSDGLLIFSQQCSGGTANSIDSWDGSTVTPLIPNLQPDAAFLVRWLRDGSGFIWQATTPSGFELRESSNTNPSSWVALSQGMPFGNLSYLDMAHQSDALIASFGSQAQVQRYSFDTVSGVSTSYSVLAAGNDGHYSPDDSQLIYRVYTRHGYNLILKTLSSGTTKTIVTGMRVSAWGGSN